MTQLNEARLDDNKDYYELDLVKARALIWKYRFHYVLFAFMAGVVSYLYSYTITPTYRSVSIVTPASAEKPQGGLGALASQLGPLTALLGSDMFASENNQVTIAILESRQFTQSFIAKYNLLSQLSGFSQEELDAMTALEAQKADWIAFKVFSDSVRYITLDVRSGLIHISIDWEEPVEGANLANSMINDLNQYLRDIAIKESSLALEYLSTQLSATANTELRSSLVSLIDQEMKSSLMANVHGDYALKVIDPAFPAVSKHNPQRRNYAFLGILLGFMLSGLHYLYLFSRNITTRTS